MESTVAVPGGHRIAPPGYPDLFDGTLALPFDEPVGTACAARAMSPPASRMCQQALSFDGGHETLAGTAPERGYPPGSASADLRAPIPILPAAFAARRRRWSCDGIALLTAASRSAGPAEQPPAVRDALRERLLELLEWLDARLASPITVSERHGIRDVTVFGTHVYRLDRTNRRFLFGERHRGRFVRSDGAVNVLNPLCTSAWLPAIAARVGLTGAADDVDRAQERWVIDAAYALLLDDPRFQVLRRGLRAALRLDPEVVRLARAAALTGPGSLTNVMYETAWQHAAPLGRVQQTAPGLLPLAWAYLREQRAPLGAYPLATLKACLVEEHGLTPAGWRLVARYGERLLGVPRRLASGSVLAMAAVYARTLAEAEVTCPPPAAIARAYLRQYLEPIEFEQWRPSEPLPVLRLAFAEAERRRGTATLEGFLDEMLLVCAWAEARAPSLNRTERRAGWPLLVKRARHWQQACQARARARTRTRSRAWPCPERAIVRADWFAVALDDAAALLEESDAMRHCAWDYARYCEEGRLRLFSLRRARDQRRFATASLKFDARTLWWALSEVRGFANREPCELARRAAAEILDAHNWPLVELKLYALAGRRSKRVYEAALPHLDVLTTALSGRHTEVLYDQVIRACGLGAEPYVVRYLEERRLYAAVPRLPHLLRYLRRPPRASR